MSKIENELCYQITMETAMQLLKESLITKAEYLEFEQEMREKYRPVISLLFSDIDLL